MGSPARAEEQPMIEMESGVSLFTGKPFCAVRWGEMSGQLTPEEMRQHGLACIATAEAAERDAAFVSFFEERKGWHGDGGGRGDAVRGQAAQGGIVRGEHHDIVRELLGVADVELDERGFAATRLLPDGRVLAVAPRTFGAGILTISAYADDPGYSDGY